MNIRDIIDLAKAGYSYKQVKELLEMTETNPEVQQAEVNVDEGKIIKQEPKKQTNTTAPLEIIADILNVKEN